MKLLPPIVKRQFTLLINDAVRDCSETVSEH